MPLIEQDDAPKLLTDYLYDLIQSDAIADLAGWSVGTVVKPGETPVNAIRVRLIGGVEEQRVADRPRLDVRLWKDGSAASEGTVLNLARQVLARFRRDFRCVVVADPIPLPDPYDTARTHVLFTVELLTRGTQS